MVGLSIGIIRRVAILLIMIMSLGIPDVKAYPRLKVRKFYLEVLSAVSSNRPDFELKDRKVDGYLNLGYENTFGRYLYNKAKISSTMSSAQFRKVGLEMEFGIEYKGIDLYVYHQSEHTMDMNGYKEFPQKNAIGLRFNFIQ